MENKSIPSAVTTFRNAQLQVRVHTTKFCMIFELFKSVGEIFLNGYEDMKFSVFWKKFAPIIQFLWRFLPELFNNYQRKKFFFILERQKTGSKSPRERLFPTDSEIDRECQLNFSPNATLPNHGVKVLYILTQIEWIWGSLSIFLQYQHLLR